MLHSFRTEHDNATLLDTVTKSVSSSCEHSTRLVRSIQGIDNMSVKVVYSSLCKCVPFVAARRAASRRKRAHHSLETTELGKQSNF